MRQVILYPGETGYWVAECPSLPGCISHSERDTGTLRSILRQAEISAVQLLEVL